MPHITELLHCAVLSIVIAVQHSCNVVNWIQKIVLHLTRHRQLKTLTVVIKCRPVMVVGKKCDVAVTVFVCLFVCLSLLTQSPLPAKNIKVLMEGEFYFLFH